jgi:uncharacterized Fe-S radical SAM superfamily protein PflX
METIHATCGPGTAVRVLDDYRPAFRAETVPDLRRPVPAEAASAARARAQALGLRVIEG